MEGAFGSLHREGFLRAIPRKKEVLIIFSREGRWKKVGFAKAKGGNRRKAISRYLVLEQCSFGCRTERAGEKRRVHAGKTKRTLEKKTTSL